MLERNLPTPPDALLPCVEPYEAMRAGSDKSWPMYAQMLAWLLDKSRTLKTIGDMCGVSRERMRCVCDEFFPGVRKDRRSYGKRSPLKRRERNLAKFRARCSGFKLLHLHEKTGAFQLGVVWHNDLPQARYVLFNGKKHYVMCLHSAAQLSGAAWYTFGIAPSTKSLRGCRGVLVVVDVTTGPCPSSRLYRVPIRKFRSAAPARVLIRLSERGGNGGGPKVAIDWNGRYLVSKFV